MGEPYFKAKEKHVKENQIGNFEVEVSNIIDFKAFYVLMHDYLSGEDWIDLEEGKDQFETYHEEKTNKDGAKNWLIWWRLKKYPKQDGVSVNGKSEKLFRYIMKLDIIAQNCKAQDVTINGKQYSGLSGTYKVKVETYLQYDIKGSLANDNIINKYFREMFDKKLYKPYIKDQKGLLFKETYDFHERIKQFLGAKTLGNTAPGDIRKSKVAPRGF
jgi:hypothetical protein